MTDKTTWGGAFSPHSVFYILASVFCLLPFAFYTIGVVNFAKSSCFFRAQRYSICPDCRMGTVFLDRVGRQAVADNGADSSQHGQLKPLAATDLFADRANVCDLHDKAARNQ